MTPLAETVRRAPSMLLALVLLALGAHSLVRELPRVAERPLAEGENAAGQWKLGGEQETRLRTTLAEAAEILPVGSLVAVEAESMSPPELFFFSMWCAYHLPEQTVLRRSVVRQRHRSEQGNYLLRWPGQPGGLLGDGAASLHELRDLRGPAARAARSP